MKRLLIYHLYVSCLIIPNFAFSQVAEGDIISLKKELKVSGSPEVIVNTKSDAVHTEYLGAYKYKIIEITESTVKLLALNFEEPKKKKREKYPDKAFLSDIYNDKIYTVSKTDFYAYYEEVDQQEAQRLTLGVLTLPYKARMSSDNLSFDTEFSLNTTLNLRFYNSPDNTFSYNVLFGSGIGNVGLNTSNASGLDQDEAIDAATLSFLTGLMYEYNKIQVGLYIGKDFINNQDIYQWEGNGNTWFGIGIGYGLFGIIKDEGGNKQNK